MSQGNDFANYSTAAAGSTGSEDVWFVAVASDDIKQMNVDQLDEAFRLGVITAETAVWTEGMDAWAPLGQVADLEGGDSEAEEAPSSDSAPAARERAESASPAFNGGAPFNITMQSARPQFSPGPSSISPVTASYAPSGHVGLSNGPVALNVDEDMPSIRHGRRFRPERWALGAAALLAIGVVGYNNMFSSSVASAGTQTPAPVLAARPYSDGAEPGEKLNAKAAATDEAAPTKAADEPSVAPVAAPTSRTSAPVAAAPSTSAAPSSDAPNKAAALTASDDADAKASDKESLKGSFSKAFNKKEKAAATKASKVKPRKASRAATKPRATKPKKPGVVRSQSAFDPLNDSLP
jgi:hypothetical protein